VAQAPARPPTPPCNASAYVANSAGNLEVKHQNLSVSTANLTKLHNIWMQSHSGSSGTQN